MESALIANSGDKVPYITSSAFCLYNAEGQKSYKFFQGSFIRQFEHLADCFIRGESVQALLSIIHYSSSDNHIKGLEK
jgi:hypothetical protein